MFRIKNVLLGDNGPTEPLSTVAEGEAADQFPPLTSGGPPVSTQQENTVAQSVPHWVREVNNSRAARHSRASSIVSTRTKFSTTTLQEDARSIDINVAGQYFRISRDGSRVTMDAPPPYTAPGEIIRFRGGQASGAAASDASGGPHNDNIENSETEEEVTTPTSIFASTGDAGGIRANILDPSEFEMPSPVGPDQLNHRSSSATLVESARASQPSISTERRYSFGEGYDEQLSPSRGAARMRPLSRENLPASRNGVPHSMPATPRRRMPLPALVTSSGVGGASNHTRRPLFPKCETSGRALHVRSAGAILSNAPNEREPRSPDYIGRDASGVFPPPVRSRTALQSQSSDTTAAGLSERESTFDGTPESHTPLPMDTENDISMHYARMMRKLDYDHRKALHLKDKELAEMRERLHEKDTVLRQQLRAKDFMIDDLKKRLSNLEENVEVMVERGRHEIEDQWEIRWQDRDFHLRERMRRIEEEAQKTTERLRAGQAELHDASKASAVAS